MVLPETELDYSVEDYSNVVTQKLLLYIGPESKITTVYQTWIYRSQL